MAKTLDVNSDEYKLGQRIQMFRKQKHMTQNGLADLMDMDRANIANYENGTKGEMGFKTLVRFSKVLGVSVDDLLDWDSETDTGQSLDNKGSAPYNTGPVLYNTGPALDNIVLMLNEENRRTLATVADGLLIRQQVTA